MKYFNFLGIILITLMSVNSLNAQEADNDYFTIVFNDSTDIFFQAKNKSKDQNFLKKERNKTSERGEIQSRLGFFIASYDDNFFMTEGVLHCLKTAMDSWESAIAIKEPIKFHVCISEDLNEDIAISTTVGYSYYNRRDLESLPDNLHRQIDNNITEHDTITINASLDWNSSWPYDNTYFGTINMSNAFMRSIAKIMGFGCSVTYRTGGLGFAISRFSSPFDKLLYNGKKYLSDLKRIGNSKDFTDFFTQPLSLKTSSFNYKMYNRGYFELGKSGVYFHLGYNNLMEDSLSDYNKLLTINPETIDIMKSIGWTPTSYDLHITCNNTDALGYGSIYDNMEFKILDSNKLPIVGNWTYQIYNPITKQYSNNSTAYQTNIFSVNPSNTDKYLDMFQCVQGKIICETNGTSYSYLTSLDARPKIEKVYIENIKDVDENSYEFDLFIFAKGATGGDIFVSDDTGTSRSYAFKNGTTHIGPMIKGYKAYIDISLSNEYGYTSKFIEKSPDYNQARRNEQNAENIDIKINGKKCTQIKDGDLITLSLPGHYKTEDIESIKWYINFKQTNNQEYKYLLSEELYCSFINKPKIFQCYFSHPYNSVLRGFDWGNLKKEVCPNDCYFSCIFSTSNKGKNNISYIRSEPIDFEVLPSTPVLTLNKTWTPIEGQDDYPLANVSIDAENFEQGVILVEQSEDHLPIYTDTIFTTIPQDGFTVYPGTWYNGIFCWVRNQYGQAMSNILKLNTTDIANKNHLSDFLIVNGHQIIINPPYMVTIKIYNTCGILEKEECTNNKINISLCRGLHLIKISDNKNNNFKNYKILIK